MLILSAFKVFLFVGCMLPISMGALGTGVLFAGYAVAYSRNPGESEPLYNTILMAFALIETFVFLGVLIAVMAFFIV